MTKKESEELKAELAKLRERIDALEKRPENHFHYYPPIVIYPTPPAPQPLSPYLPWWSGGTICGTVQTLSNRMENQCAVN